MLSRVGIVGVGLIGGSLALAAKQRNLAREVIGVGRHPERLRDARERGMLDVCSTRLADVATGCDLVVFAVPVLTFPPLLEQFAVSWNGSGVVTDVGSTKMSTIRAARRELGPHYRSFVPGHPIAGRERAGHEFAEADLFVDHRVILTPTQDTDPAAVELVTGFWRAVGARVVTMPVEQHDTTLAATSHLPHLLAYALVAMLAGRSDAERVFEFAAGGFRDFTRVASSDPDMWADICLDNREAIETVLRDYQRCLHELQTAMHAGDRARLRSVLERAKVARDEWLDSQP